MQRELGGARVVRVGWGDGDYFTGKSKSAATATTAHVAAAVTPAADEDDVLRVDLRGGALLALLVLPLGVLDAPFDADLPALGEDAGQRLGALAPELDRVPVRALLALAREIGERLGGGDAQREHGAAALGVAQLRVLPEVADESDAIEAFCHGDILF